MKRCPKCGKNFADDANFCPVDAGRLVAADEPASPATDGLIGGRFELGPQIGGSTTGPVHRAVDRKDGAAVAIKLVSAEVMAIPAVAQRIERELKQLERVQHPAVVRVLGSGRTEIARALFGVDRLVAGEVLVGGRPIRLRSPADAVAAGIALVPENRKSDGLFFNFQGQANMSIAKLSRLGPAAAMSLATEARLVAGIGDRLELSAGAADRLVGLLSGGNQQKIVIGRWLFAGARIYVLDEPTQGIDVGARAAVYDLINELTEAGNAVVLISSDDNELLAMSDRIGIVSHGRLVDIRKASDVQKTDLLRASAKQETAA